MLPSILLALACSDGPTAPQPSPAFGVYEPPPPGPDPDEVTETFPVVAGALDLWLVVDPALADAVLDGLPRLLDPLIGAGLDWRVGLVSTALGDPATAGARVDLGGPDGWLTPAVAAPGPIGAFPDLPPLGARGASAIALEARRPGAEARVLVAQAADDATPGSPTAAEWAALHPDVGLVVVGPEPAPALDAWVDAAAGARFPPEALDDALAGLPLGAPGLEQVFALAGAPEPGTLDVRVDHPSGAQLAFAEDQDWVLDPVLNAVVFLEYVPGPGAVVVVRYRERR